MPVQKRLLESLECMRCAGAGFIPILIRNAVFDQRTKRWRPRKFKLVKCELCDGTGARK